jgi:hypothetical protein
MSTRKKINKQKFWIVVLGLLLLIGLTAGGTYVLNEQDLISAGGESQDGPLADRAEYEEGAERPEPPDHGGEGGGFNSQSLVGLFKVVLQISIVVVVIAGGQWLLSWLQQRWRRALAHSG